MTQKTPNMPSIKIPVSYHQSQPISKINITHDQPSYLCCPDALSMVGDPLS